MNGRDACSTDDWCFANQVLAGKYPAVTSEMIVSKKSARDLR